MRYVIWTVMAAVLIAFGLGGWVYWRSEAHLRSFAATPAFAAAIPSDRASLARGEQLARTRGCLSCHGDQLEGRVFSEGPWGERAVAPALSSLARRESPATLERAIRHGVGRDGRALYSMPSYNFVRLTDDDVAALIGFMRAAPQVEASLPRAGLGLRVRWALATGADAAIPAFVPQVPALSFQQHPDPAVRRGEYLAMTSCNECHGFGLRGDDPFGDSGSGPPDLVMVASYDRVDFIRLMRTGKAAGGRELPMMSPVARRRFIHWSDTEVEDLYVFLRAMAAKADTAP